ncbi:MAG: response regulator transcription factor [Thermoleophilia bacterium]
MPTSVAVVEDHPLFREVLEHTIRQDPELRCVAAFPNAEPALELLGTDPPDVLIVDLDLPGRGGMALLADVAVLACSTRCIVLSGAIAPEEAYTAVQAGAAGVLTKQADRSEVIRAIHAVARGEAVLGTDIQTGLADQIRTRAAAAGPQLNERERAVLELAATGLSNEEIGRRIHLSPATVKTYLRQVFDKLGARDRASAVAEAMRRGLID